jgi:hypothetical protein
MFISVPSSGYELFFGLNLKLIFGLLLFFLTLKQKGTSEPISKSDLALLLFLGIAFLNTFFFWGLAPIVGLIRLWLSILFYFSAKLFFKKEPKLFSYLICAIYLFSTLFGLSQLMKQKPLGKFIELTPSFSQEEGYSTTDGKSQFRVSGFISHPVYFGSFMGILLPIFIATTYTLNPTLSLLGTALGIIVMLGTHSRTVWITIALSIVLLYQQLIPNRQDFIRLITKNRPLIIFFVFVASFLVLSRLPSITSLFAKNGNGSIRGVLAWQSLQIIAEHPFGVGLNQFTTSLVSRPLPPSLNGFIVPVHNTILLIISELGIFAGALFIYFVVKTILVNRIVNIVHYGAIVGAIAFLISSQFHPLLNLDPTFDLFMLTLGFVSSQCPPSTT